MNLFDRPIDGEIRSIEPYQLHQYTLDGWLLLGSYDDATVLPYTEQAIMPPPTGGSTGYQSFPSVTNLQQCKVGHATRFLVRRDPESALGVATAGQKAAEAKFAERDKEVLDIRQIRDNLAKEVARLEELAGVSATKLDNSGKINVDLNLKIRKMEADLGKIRGAIGELRMKEILGQ